jgi:hypothetical protein
MKYNRTFRLMVLVLTMFMITGCLAVVSPQEPQEAEKTAPTRTATTVKTPLPTLTLSLTSTQTPKPTPTITPTITPSPVPTQVVLSGIVRRLCPELHAPLGLFSIPDPVYDNTTTPATLYILYEVVELGLASSSASCTFYLSPPPIGAPQFAGDSLFWMSFDDENEWMMVWKYDSSDVLMDDEFPQHTFLRQTRTNTSIGKMGLYDFLVAESGETLVWTYTDPQPLDENEMGYLQKMYGAATSGPIDQHPAVEIWNDFTLEGDSAAKIFRPRRFSLDEGRIFYSQEPVGLGRQWPEPLGQYTSLYSLSTWWDTAYPELHYNCDREYWCISDFSEKQDLLIHVHADALQIIELSSGDLIQEVEAPQAYPLLRQALISPDGAIAFLGVALGESDYGDPPEDAAIFIIAPPYQAPPDLLLHDAGLLNLVGWASLNLLVADGNNLAENAAGNSTLPADLMLVDIDAGVGTWLPLGAERFVSLVP